MSTDVDILARTLYGESRGEGIEGKIAVANVVLNRTRRAAQIKEEWRIKRGNLHNYSNQFGTGTIETACLRPYQFSCWNEKDPNRKKILAVKNTEPHFAECIVVAKMALAGLLVDNTLGATHYHVTSMGFPPAWLHKDELPHKPCVVIGKHSFYNTVK
jgi:N-acetylmuramoyl-L-alanine amidase